jgi:LmbE family N-acetylglucosaminyl deacetylase
VSGPRGNGTPFDGDIMIVAPHMDDETLGCGQLLASRRDTHASHVVFATDGAASHDSPQTGAPSSGELSALRKAEAAQALAVLGVPGANIEFLDFPDGRLGRRIDELAAAISDQTRRRAPAFVFVPFRYDRHPDHLAVNRAVAVAFGSGRISAQVVEYFVNWQWRLLRTGDVRDYVVSEDQIRYDSRDAAAKKRSALACYRTQTTRYFDWQRRPILTEALIERVCTAPETFLIQRAGRGGRRALARGRSWVPVAHSLEPALKRWKDRLAERFGP